MSFLSGAGRGRSEDRGGQVGLSIEAPPEGDGAPLGATLEADLDFDLVSDPFATDSAVLDLRPQQPRTSKPSKYEGTPEAVGKLWNSFASSDAARAALGSLASS